MTEPGEPVRVADRHDELTDAERLGLAERRPGRGRSPSTRSTARSDSRSIPTTSERQLAPVDERRAPAPTRPATTCAEVSRNPSGVSATALPGAGRHVTAARAPRHPQVRHRRREPLGDVDDHPRVGVERRRASRRRSACRFERRAHRSSSPSERHRDASARRCRGRSAARASASLGRRRAPRTARRSGRSRGRRRRRSDRRARARPARRRCRSRPRGRARRRARAVRRRGAAAGRRAAARSPRRAARLGRRSRRGRAPRRARASAASAGIARIRPPSTRTRVDAEQPTVGVEQRAARAAARQRRGVLDRAGDPPAARAAEAAGGRGDEARRDAQAATAGVAEREHEPPDLDGRAGSSGAHSTGSIVAGVDLDHGDVEVGIGPGDAAGLRAVRRRTSPSPRRGAGCGRS